MFLPSKLRHVFLAIPRKRIRLSQEQDVSILNSVKAWIKDSTQVRWKWWPLEP
jgi:hypothetical protein